MFSYILKRLLLMVPTLFGILALSFLIIQFAPGGPIERVLSQIHGHGDSLNRLSGAGMETATAGQGGAGPEASYRGAQGLDPEFIKKLEVQFGFDKPAHERFFKMVWDYLRFDFGQSYFRDISVIDLILEKMPVSISLGLWLTLISYLVSVPLGIAKAVRDGARFDIWTSAMIIVGYAVPGFVFAVFLRVVFAGSCCFSWFPSRGLFSDDYATFSLFGQVVDYFWHLALPLLALCIGSFASMTLLTKNSFLEEMGKQYVLTARAKGAKPARVLYGHVFQNAMLIVISGFPAAFIGAFFTGSLLIETVFSLDGLGLLAYKSALDRDYPVVFATLYIFSLLGLFANLLTDVVYTLVDPRIDFEKRGV